MLYYNNIFKLKKLKFNMVSDLYHIKINSDEENKDKGLYALMTSGASVVCLEGEEYIAPEEAIEKLNEKKISYEIITKKEYKE